MEEIERLEKEADWLALQLAQEPTVYHRCFGCETNLFGDACVKCWREEARRAVEDVSNNS